MARTLAIALLSAVLLSLGSARAAPKAARAELDAKHTLAVKAAFAKANGARAALGLPAAQISKAAALEKKLSPAQRAARARAGARLLAAVHAAAKSKEPEPVITPKLVSAIEADVKLLGSRDPEVVSALLLQGAADRQAERLAAAAKAAEQARLRSKRLRESITGLKDLLSSWGSQRSQTVSWTEADGRELTGVLTKSEAETLLARLEPELETASDKGEMTQIDLQDALNEQTQALQTLSSISKTMHDTAKAIIDNIKA
jgi:hypothetical protein